MEKKLVRLFELHAMERDGDASYNRIYTFIHNMQRYFGDDTKHRILTAHHKVKVYNLNEFIHDLYKDDVRFDILIYFSNTTRFCSSSSILVCEGIQLFDFHYFSYLFFGSAFDNWEALGPL